MRGSPGSSSRSFSRHKVTLQRRSRAGWREGVLVLHLEQPLDILARLVPGAVAPAAARASSLPLAARHRDLTDHAHKQRGRTCCCCCAAAGCCKHGGGEGNQPASVLLNDEGDWSLVLSLTWYGGHLHDLRGTSKRDQPHGGRRRAQERRGVTRTRIAKRGSRLSHEGWCLGQRDSGTWCVRRSTRAPGMFR